MDEEHRKELNRRAQRAWRARQKLPYTIIYKVVLDDTILWIGKTRWSLKKRLGDLRSTVYRHHPRKHDIRIELIEQVAYRDNADNRLYCIRKQHAHDIKKPNRHGNETRVYKGGIEHEGTFYPTKKALWKEKGQTSYNTFMVRLHRSSDINYALGLNFH